MTNNLKTYSLVIGWYGNDDEQGTYGETVKARDQYHAERIVRARMCWNHWSNYRGPGESRRESLDSYRNNDGSYFGIVMDCTEGAAWKAAEMETTLRDIILSSDADDAGSLANAIEAAKKIIAEIDGI